ncbi:hypothetical protein BGZ52_011475, partial [Haplosporangium bisporale]
MLRLYNNSDLDHQEILTNFFFTHAWNSVEDVEEDYFFLFSRSERAREFNQGRLDAIEGETHSFVALDGVGRQATETQQRITEMQTGLPTELHIKVGARVMCLANISMDTGVVNGALGTVTGIRPGMRGVVDSVIQVEFDGRGTVDVSAECRTVMGKTYSR